MQIIVVFVHIVHIIVGAFFVLKVPYLNFMFAKFGIKKWLRSEEGFRLRLSVTKPS